MARSTKNGSKAPTKTGTPVKSANVEWGGYIDLRLDEHEVQQFTDWLPDFKPSMWIEFSDLLGAGFKFGLSYDPKGDFYLASFTAHGRELTGLENRYCLTARAPEWEDALALLLFKHLVLMDGYWGNYKPRSQTLERFG